MRYYNTYYTPRSSTTYLATRSTTSAPIHDLFENDVTLALLALSEHTALLGRLVLASSWSFWMT